MRLLRRSLLLVSLAVLLTVGGTLATWAFAGSGVIGASASLTPVLGVFNWDGSEVLPDDVVGEDHIWLITNLVAGENASGEEIGLNNPDSPLNDYINDRLDGGLGYSRRDYFGSMAVTGGRDMEELFGADAINLTFMVYVASDTEYYVFTTGVDLGERGEPNWLGTSNKTPGQPTHPLGTYISPIYRTRLTRPTKNADWEIVETKEGKALSCWYDENRRNNVTQIPSFDPTSWVEE